LEELRNYRALPNNAANPQSTMIMGPSDGANATVAMRPGGLPGMHTDDPATAAAAHSVASRAGNPVQTPALRRTGSIAAIPEPKKKSVVGTFFAALLLIGVIAYCTKKLLPIYY